MQIATFDFTVPTEYQLPASMQIVEESLRLKLLAVAQDFVEDFTDDTDFDYEPAKDEFVAGKIQQIDQRPADAIFYAKFNININGNWGEGLLTGTAYGGAAIADNALDLNYDDQRYVQFDDPDNSFGAQGTIEFEIKPGWSDRPSNRQCFFNIGDGLSTNHRIRLYQYEASAGGVPGRLRLDIYNDSGVLIAGGYLPEWSPVADTWYTFSVNVNCTGGTHRLFIDGTLFGSITGTGTRTPGNDVHVGAPDNAANFSIRNFIIYDSVQRTTNYTPDWSNVHETVYLESAPVLPEMAHLGDGTISALNSLALTSTGSPRLSLQIGQSGNYLYWNGSGWVVSNGDYTQASPAADYNTYKSELPVAGESYGQFKLHFPASNTQCSVDILTVNMSIELYAQNTTCLCLIPVTSKKFVQMLQAATISGSDDIQYILYKDCELQDYYHNGTAWVPSAGYPQSNTFAEIAANIGAFLDGSQTEAVYLKIVLISANGLTTPILNKVILKYFTKVGYTFKNYTVPDGQWGEVLTADDVRFTQMWGVDMQASDVQSSEIDDAQLQWCVDSALSMWEKELNIDIRKKVYKTDPDESLTQARYWSEGVDYTDEDDRYDFVRQQWWNYGFLQLMHYPVLSVEKAEFYDRLGGLIMDVTDWVRIHKKSGQLQIYPKGTFSLGSGGWSGSSIFAAWPGMLNNDYPDAFAIDYTTGFKSSDFVPDDLRGMIAIAATIMALEFVGDGLFAGFSSSSISLDGLSESFSSTQSATSAYFGARIKSYLDQMKTWRQHNKYKYSNIPIGMIHS